MPSPPSSSEEGNFSIFTTLRYDPLLLSSTANTSASSLPHPTPFYLLSHHRDRMLQAAENFSYPSSATSLLQSLSAFARRLQDAVDAEGEGALRAKAILTRTGELTVELGPTPVVSLSQLYPEALPLPPLPAGREDMDWTVVLDQEETEPSEFTTFKTTVRGMYDHARMRVGIQGFAERREVLLWNPRGEVMEGSLTSVYVYVKREGEGEGEGAGAGWRWVTPVLGSGGQKGTTRRWALERGLAEEEVVMKEDVKPGDWVVLSNGLRGAWGGWAV
ncbi:aminotransferase [Tricharina praecox]|uniref:aminotransferase n=1 Tax=Tricharina praecox TaxID=43433 RepID=UPI0022201298|nr:aminotransferase [Tricharina praecox]KAI5856991.1 aminotransferase [Tricharina praecox]